jgi:hypothetical protein
MPTRQEILAAADPIETAVIDPDGRRLTRASAENLAELILTAAEKARAAEQRLAVGQIA